jgi:hypothetical protein
MTDTYRPGILGTTGSFGSIQFTDGNDGGSQIEIMDSSQNLKNIQDVQVSGAVDFDSTLNVDGAATLGSTLGVTGEATLASATVSDLTSGRIVLAGTAGALEDNGNLAFDGSTLTVTGDISAESGSFSGDMTITGDLTVNGTTTTVNSTAVSLGDRIIELNSAQATGDSGLKVFDADSPETTGSFLYDSTAHRWKGGEEGSESILVDRGSNESITGTKTFTALTASSADINGGTVDGADVTVGDGKTLDVSAGTLTLADNQISGDKVEGGTIASITISQLGGAMDANSQAMTNVNIDSGNIDGATIATSDITVGASKTLDVSAGTLTLANDQISGDKVEGGTINATTINTLTSTTVNATNVSASGYVSASSFEVDGQASISYDSSALDFSTGGAGAALSANHFSASVELQGASLAVSGASDLGAVTMAGALDANSSADFQGAVNLQAGLTVAGAATFNGAGDFNSGLTASSMQVDDLTSGRVTYAGASGELQDSANLAFDGTDLTVGGDIRLNGNQVKNSDGTAMIDFGDSEGLAIGDGSIEVVIKGGVIKDAGGYDAFRLDDNGNTEAAYNFQVGSDLTVNGRDIILMGAEDGEANIKSNTSDVFMTLSGTASSNNRRVEVAGDMSGSGDAYFASLDLNGTTQISSILDEDGLTSDSATALATQQSIKAYVDAQLGSQDVDFAGDSGTGAVDLDTQSLTIAGTNNEIETSASGQTLTIGLPDDVTIGQDLTVTRNLAVDGNVDLGSDSSDLITANGLFDSHLLPDGATRNIGGSGANQRWGDVYATNVYTGDFHMKNERGDWTLFEESDHIRIRNNATGQEFKLDMTPVAE